MRGKLGALLLKVILLAWISIGTAHAVSYTYDELGRLKSVTDNAGNSAEYVYDPVGNIVQIKQIPSGTLSITEFTPNSGPIGASVTIFGGGFSTTAASNVVKFNGTTATVTSAAVNKLVVNVPAGATTGKITVTVGTTTTTSTDDFVVTANTGAPTITGFTPTCAVPGSTVTLTGTNFDPVPNATKVEIGSSVVPATANSPTSITLIVPSGISSGNIRVVTSTGIATSATPLDIRLTCADLAPTSLTAPAQVGYQFNVSWTVQNSGTSGTSPFTWNDRVYLSSDALWDVSDSQVAALGYNAALAAGASYTQTATANVPASKAPGNYYLIVVTDKDGQVPETNETNNAKTVPISIVAPDLDLIPTTLTAPAQVAYQFGVSWTVQNNGTGSTSPFTWSDRVYLSSDAVWDASDSQVASLSYNTALAAGASYTQTTTANVPASKAPGNYYLIVVTDKDSNVPETNETNNAKAIPISLTAPNLDLSPATLTAPASVGIQFSVSWTVQNSGSSNTSPFTWNDRVYLSSDAVWDASDSQVATLSYTAPLAAGASYTQTTTASIPTNKAPGNYYLIVVADQDGQVPETNETNNTKAIPISIVAPDLVPTGLTAPAQVAYQFSVSWTVQNSGNSSTSPISIWADRVYLSSDAVWDASDTHVAALSYNTALAAGASYTQTATANVPTGKAPGNYYLIVVADQDGYVPESNETNNAKAIPISLSMPDLVPTALTAPAQVKVGSQFSVSWMAQNSGTRSTSPYNSWIDRVYLSTDAVWDALDSQVTAWFYDSALAAGTSYTFTAIPANVPSNKAPGNYYLIVVTDKDGNVPEGNETNNAKAIPINLTP